MKLAANTSRPKDINPEVWERIEKAARTIRAKYLQLQAEKHPYSDNSRGKPKKFEDEELRDSRTPRTDHETIKQIDEHSRKIKALYDSLKASRSENARALESSYRPLAKILSSTIEKANVGKQTTPFKTPTTRKRRRDGSRASPTLIRRPRYPLAFDPPRNEQEEQEGEEPAMQGDDDENIEPEPVAADETQPEPINQTANTDDEADEDEEEEDLNRTVYEHNPQESFFYDDDFRLDPNTHPIHTEAIPEESFEEYMDQYDQLPREFVRGFIRDTSNKYDRTYLRHDYETDHIYFGDSKVEFKGPDIVIKGEKFKGTPGLYELLFKTIPLRNKYTDLDEQAFAKIVLLTNANKRNFDPNQQNVGNRGLKYTHTIKPILQKIQRENEERQKQRDKQLRLIRQAPTGQAPQGHGFQNNKVKGGHLEPLKVNLNYKEFTNNKFDYVYWDDPNELVDRLKVLVASSEAGNNSHNNEILSIVEELREAGIIE